MEIKEQLEGLKTDILATTKGEIATLVEKHAKTIAEGSEEAAKSVKTEIETKLNDLQAKSGVRLDELEVEFNKLKKQGAGNGLAMQMTAQKSIQKTLDENEAFKKYKNRDAVSSGVIDLPFSSPVEMEQKAIMTFSASTTGQVVDNAYLPGIYGNVRRQTRMRNLMRVGSMAGDKVPYLRQTGTTNSAATVAEGAAKPQSDKTIALAEAPARKIAHHMRLSDELLNDLPVLSSFITDQGVQDLLDIEDTQILYGDGNSPNLEGITTTSGITDAGDIALGTVASAQLVDAIVAAFSALATNEFMADTVVLNPAQYYSLFLIKGTDGQYVSNPAMVFVNGQPTIKGIPVIESTAVTAGNILVGNFARGFQLFQREGVSVRFFDQDQDNAIKNLITVVIEERIALPIFYEGMVYYDSVADTLNALS